MKKLILIFLAIIASVDAKDADEEGELKRGNLALPASQQISPLFSFGQHVIEQGVLQAYSYVYWLKGRKQESALVFPAILYGITNELSCFIDIPVYAENRIGNQKSLGVGDIDITFEYAIFNKNSKTSSDEITFLASLYLPTGTSKKNPATGLGATSFFLGTTYSHISIDWYYYTSYGAWLTTSKNYDRTGNQFLYQGGFGKNIPTSPEWIFTWVLEFNGFYNERNEIDGVIDCNSGGNIIYIGPSLWLSSEKFIFQSGISFPVYQNLFGKQNKTDYWAAISLGYTF